MTETTIYKAHEGEGQIDVSAAPDWWLSAAAEGEAFVRGLPNVEFAEIGRSAGGRPIVAAFYGVREDLPGRTSNSLASAISGGEAAAFYGEGERKRQSLMFLGNAHGLEFEGTVAALNMLNVLVTGADLRGRAWPRMREAGRDMRIVVVPHFNIDGRERFPLCRQTLNLDVEARRRLVQGEWKDGRKLKWPKSKLVTPLPPEQMATLGAYYNDNGVNLVYDTAFSAEPQPETRALLALLREERPECVVLAHTDHGSLVCELSSFIPERFRQRQAQIGALCGAGCKYKGFQKWAIPERSHGYAGEVFYQTDLVYHVCGALPLMVEFPCGYQNKPDNFDNILDIGLTVIEELLVFGAAYGFRPHEPATKTAASPPRRDPPAVGGARQGAG